MLLFTRKVLNCFGVNNSPNKSYYTRENNLIYFRVNISHKKYYYSRDKMILLFRVNNIQNNPIIKAKKL